MKTVETTPRLQAETLLDKEGGDLRCNGRDNWENPNTHKEVMREKREKSRTKFLFDVEIF